MAFPEPPPPPYAIGDPAAQRPHAPRPTYAPHPTHPHPGPHPPQGVPGVHGAPGPGRFGPAPPFRPRIDRAAVRPRALWFWVGALTVPAGIALGAVAMAALMSGPRVPEFAGEVQTSGSVVFEVAEGEDGAWGLWVSPEDASHYYDCELEGAADGAYSFRPSGDAYASHGWRLAEVIDTPAPGTYTLVCDGDGGVSYAVGDTATAEEAASRRLAGLGALVLLSLAGLGAGTAVIVVTAVRRGRSERSLRREAVANATGVPGGPGPAAGPAPPGRGVTVVGPEDDQRPR